MMDEMVIGGHADARFKPVVDLFRDSLASGADLGASFAATIAGQTVIDIWGGWADAARSKPWASDTIANVYSTTKTMAALCALILADRGELDFAAPVSHYWPEFAAGGKADIPMSQIMAHSSGLSGWRDKLVLDDLYDWDKATALLAAQAPFWEPGTAPGYHAVTQGYLVGEVVRRITGQSIGNFFRSEIAEPLGADFHIGLAASNDHRVAELIPPPPPELAAGERISDIRWNMLTNPPVKAEATRTRAWRAAEIPAANGHGNARSVAEIHAILANGGRAKGKQFLSAAGCRRALVPQIEGTDLVLAIPVHYGLGFGLPPMIPMPGAQAMFWGGYGGSLAVIDMERHTTCAYVMNRMGQSTVGDDRALRLAKAFWANV